jgi:putative transposase
MENDAMADPIHLCLSTRPKYGVANMVGFLKARSAIPIHRNYLRPKWNFGGLHFGAKGYYVSTAGLDEEGIRAYIRSREDAEKPLELRQIPGP